MRPTLRALARALLCALLCAGAAGAALVAAAGVARAQVSIPNIRKPIDAAKKAAAKTSEQIRSAEKAGGSAKVSDAPGAAAAAQAADQRQKAAAASQKSAPAQPKSAPAPQKGAPAPQKGAAPPAKGAAPPAKAGAPGTRPDSATAGQPGARRGAVTIYREVFSYTAGGMRDPFVSLMLSGELRPILTDLTLRGVIYDPEGRRSIALLVDASTGESYRVRIGQSLARMKVTKIGMQDITFSIDEFGLSRSETLIIDKTKKAGAPAPGRP